MHRTRGKPISREDLRAGTTVWLKTKCKYENGGFTMQTDLVDIIRVDRESGIMELKKHNTPWHFVISIDFYGMESWDNYLCYTDE